MNLGSNRNVNSPSNRIGSALVSMAGAIAMLWAASIVTTSCGDDSQTSGDSAQSGPTTGAGGAEQPCEAAADEVCFSACGCPDAPCDVEYEPNTAYGDGTYETCFAYFAPLFCNSNTGPFANIDPNACQTANFECGALGEVLPASCGGPPSQ